MGSGSQTPGNISPVPGHAGQIPAAGVSPIPGAPQPPPSAILPTKPVMGSGGQTPGNISPVPGHAEQIPAAGGSPIPGAPQTPPSAILPRPGGRGPLSNQPTSSSSGRWPTKLTGLAYGPAPGAHVVLVEGKMPLPNLIDKCWMRYIVIAMTNAA